LGSPKYGAGINLLNKRALYRVAAAAVDEINYNMMHMMYDTKVVPVIMYHTMKTYGRVELKIHAFLTSALDGDERSSPYSGRFISGTY
jgi:hypothetical protein